MTTSKPSSPRVQLSDEEEMRRRLAGVRILARRQIRRLPGLADELERWHDYLVATLAGRRLPAIGVLAGVLGALSTFVLDANLDGAITGHLRSLVPFVLDALIHDREVLRGALDSFAELVLPDERRPQQ